MCLILLAWHCHPRYPLVVAANRDEFFARPTAAARYWPEAPDLLAGRDLRAGGTWMGCDRRGRFAALTNYRDPATQREGLRSRGHLVADYLAGDAGIDACLTTAQADADRYNGYNLLLADGSRLAWYSNIGGQAPRSLEPGVYGVSNHLLDTPWPKLVAAKSALTQALDALPDDAPLFALLRDDRIHPDEALPRTGVSLPWERLLSAAFVKSADYGTVGSTVLLIDRSGTAAFDEQTWLPGGIPGGRVRYRYSLTSTSV